MFVECTLIRQCPEGRRLPLRLQLGPAYVRGDGVWACPVQLHGLFDKLKDIRGANGEQALQLAYRLAHYLLVAEMKRGSKFFFPHAPEEVDPMTLFHGVL